MHPHREPASRHDMGFAYWQPPLDNKQIFRAMIDAELNAGRLNERRRATIVRYAAQMGLSAVEAGRLVSECQAAAVALPASEPPSLRFVPALPRRVMVPAHVAITTGILLLVIWLLR